MHNHFTTEKGHQIIIIGWKKAGVYDLFIGSANPSPKDPFESIYQ